MALAMAGCPQTGPGTGNNNNNNNGEPASVTVTIFGQGTVDQSAQGNMVTLTANPGTGWDFDRWSEADVDDPEANPITVDATDIETITATFIMDRPSGPVCGDSVLDRSEECDDGNTDDGDGCSRLCEIEEIEPVCGNALVEEGEQCDDNNTVNGDGCSATCQSEPPPPPPPGCGDGVVNATEECDDSGESETCNTDCTTSACGDGVRNATAGEQCDDGNTVAGDGCGASCQNESGGGGGGGGGGAVCGNGTRESNEQCDDGNTTPGDGCSATCQNEPPPAGCGDGVVNGTEQCDDSGESATCNANCTMSLCGDGTRNATAGEQCDDGNTTAGDGCSATCQTEATGLTNNSCNTPTAVGNGTRTYSNVGATTDGPASAACDFGLVDAGQVGSDIWYCYTATCTGPAFFSLCGSQYDTKLAVYEGCGCPNAAPIGCSDDDCGTDLGNFQSRVALAVTSGQSYLVRVGGYNGEQGEGRLTIGCNVDTCATSTGDCFTGTPTSPPGCHDAANSSCCADTCELDRFCCDVAWDETCADEAAGVCTGNFPACAPSSGPCETPQATGGCSNASCCNSVCNVDPFCCLDSWDSICVEEAASMCP